MAKPNLRPDHNGTQRAQFNSNKKKIYATQTVCGICGKRVDFKLKFPHPLSPCIDHIIPVAKGGDPSDISNLQLAHLTCNRQKSDINGVVIVVKTNHYPVLPCGHFPWRLTEQPDKEKKKR